MSAAGEMLVGVRGRVGWPAVRERRALGPATWLLGAAAAAVATLVLLVPAYLVLRTASAGSEALEILARVQMVPILGNTVLLAGAVTAAAVAIALPVAWLTTCTDLPGRRAWTVLAALPLVLPSYAAAYVVMTMLAPKGLVQQFLAPFTGLERMPSLMGFPGAFLVLTLVCYPYVLLTVRAALQRMDPALIEAALSLGASPWRVWTRVVLPYLRPSIMAGGLLVALYVLRDFGAVAMWQYNTFTRVIYNRYLSYRLETAAALALVLLALTYLILYWEHRSRGRARYARLATGSARKPRLRKLGHWKWPALALLTALVLVSLVLPALGLGIWLWRGWQQAGLAPGGDPVGAMGTLLSPLWQPAWNSVYASLLAAAVTVACALPVAVLAVRRPGRASRYLERVTYAGFALPGIVVALALVFFGINYVPAFYQSLPMLLAAYVILFLPQAAGAQRASLLQVSPAMEEAARSLGQRPIAVLRKITLPLVQPGILAGGVLVFLTAMKELPATLILSPLGFTTLAAQVWTHINEAFFAQAALPTLLILLLSSLPLAMLTLRER